MSSVVLVGFMGAGKTTIGHALAQTQKLPFHDLDRVLERRFGLSLPEVFACHGEAVFRGAEAEALRDLVAGPAAVIALGGGAFSSAANRAEVRRSNATSVFLDVPWALLWRRIAATSASRPKLADPETTRRLYERRLPDYERADIRLHIHDGDEPDEIAARIVDLTTGAACGT